MAIQDASRLLIREKILIIAFPPERQNAEEVSSDQLALVNPVLFNFAKDAQRLATLLLFGQGLQPPFHLGGQLTGTN